MFGDLDFKKITQIWVFLVTCFSAEVFLFLAIRIANKCQLYDKPDFKRKLHTLPIPTVGGIAVYLAFVAGLFFAGEGWNVMVYPLLGATVCMMLGLIDDIKPVSAVVKLCVLSLITFYIYLQTDKSIQVNFFPQLPILNVTLSILWIVGMMSAINSLDNMDGLASGVTAIASAFIFFIAWRYYDRWVSFMAIGLCAACLTFLRYNFFQSRAAIFLGDNGSYFLGFMLACLSMMGAWTDPRIGEYSGTERFWKAVLVPPILLGVPIFDIITATVLRLVHGEVKTVKMAIIYCGQDHTSHRLVALGFSRRQAVLILWALGFSLGVVALVIQLTREPQLYFSLAGLTFALLLGFAFILSRAKVYAHQKTETNKSENDDEDEDADETQSSEFSTQKEITSNITRLP